MSEIDVNTWSDFYIKGFIYILLGFVVSLIILLNGWYSWLNYFNDKPEIWFQRSGSLMVICLIFSEYHIYNIASDISKPNVNISTYAIQTKILFKPYIKPIQFIAIFLAIISTFIWGYGDLLFLKFKSLI